MRPSVVVPLDPVANCPTRLLNCLERVLPDTLFFQTPKGPFDHPGLLRCIRRNELLLQTVVPTGLPKPAALANQSIVTAEDRGPTGRSVPNR